MVLVRMRQRDHVNLLKPPRPQVGRHRFFTGVNAFVLLATRESAKCPATINQQRPSMGRHHEQGIPLAYIQDGRFQFSS